MPRYLYKELSKMNYNTLKLLDSKFILERYSVENKKIIKQIILWVYM